MAAKFTAQHFGSFRFKNFQKMCSGASGLSWTRECNPIQISHWQCLVARVPFVCVIRSVVVRDCVLCAFVTLQLLMIMAMMVIHDDNSGTHGT